VRVFEEGKKGVLLMEQNLRKLRGQEGPYGGAGKGCSGGQERPAFKVGGLISCGRNGKFPGANTIECLIFGMIERQSEN